MKIAIGYKLISSSWGGGNQFATSLVSKAREKGYEITFSLQDKNIDIRIFGKPETKPFRRLGVILASNLKKAKEALSKIKVVNV